MQIRESASGSGDNVFYVWQGYCTLNTLYKNKLSAFLVYHLIVECNKSKHVWFVWIVFVGSNIVPNS